MHALSAKLFHEGTERELIQLASPIFDPAQGRIGGAIVGDRNLGKQYGIIAKGSKNDVIDCVLSG